MNSFDDFDTQIQCEEFYAFAENGGHLYNEWTPLHKENVTDNGSLPLIHMADELRFYLANMGL